MADKMKKQNIKKEDISLLLDRIYNSYEILSQANEDIAENPVYGKSEAQTYMSNVVGDYMTKLKEKESNKKEDLVYIM